MWHYSLCSALLEWQLRVRSNALSLAITKIALFFGFWHRESGADEKEDQFKRGSKAEQGLLLPVSLLLLQMLRCPTRSVLAWLWSLSLNKEQSETRRSWRGSENGLWGNPGNFSPRYSLSWGCGFIPYLALCLLPPPCTPQSELTVPAWVIQEFLLLFEN